MTDMDELIARLERAHKELLKLAARAVVNPHAKEKDRLLAKAEGVGLALSYARECVAAAGSGED